MPRRLVILNFGTPTEKVPEFLDHLLQKIMKERKSHIKDTTDFLDKLNDLGQMSEVALLLLYPSIPNAEYLKVLPKQYEKFLQKKVHTEDIVNWQTSY